MDDTMRNACRHHKLSGIGVNIFDVETGDITVYLHRRGGCASASGRTFISALDKALEELDRFWPAREG